MQKVGRSVRRASPLTMVNVVHCKSLFARGGRQLFLWKMLLHVVSCTLYTFLVRAKRDCNVSQKKCRIICAILKILCSCICN